MSFTLGGDTQVARATSPVPARLIALSFYEASATRIIAVDATVKVFIGR